MSGNRKQHTVLPGEKYGEWTVLEVVRGPKNNVLVRCSCGFEGWRRKHTIATGQTVRCDSCGAKAGGKSNRGVLNSAAHQRVWNVYQWQARRRKLEWLVTPSVFKSMIEMDCWYCGSPPSGLISSRKTDSGVSLYYSGLDRINNTVGYRDDNIVPCCKTCNFAKGQMTLDDFLLWISKLFRRQGII